MRPLLEYASIVWDGCTNYEKESLEKLQYEAARVVTGLTRSVSIQSLVKEIGWVSLSDRRKIQKLVIFYKYKNGILPQYLESLFPDTVATTSNYNLRNNNNHVTVARRSQLYANSFIPSATDLWNSLSIEIRNSRSLSIFKTKIKELFQAPKVPKYYLVGDRYLSVVHARLRNNCSSLNNDLYLNHVREDPYCECGLSIENAEHYL